MKVLILVDCLRYDVSDIFEFAGYQKLNKVISVSNWTVPALTTMLTGLHPFTHKVCPMPCNWKNQPDRENYVSYAKALEQDKLIKLPEDIPTLIEKYDSYATAEIPVLGTIKDNLGYIKTAAWKNGGCKNAIKAINEGKEFVFLHLKGGHSHFSYGNDEEHFNEYNYENYIKEFEALKPHLEKIAKLAKEKADKVVIIADHGQLWEEVDHIKYNHGHGGRFHLSLLHVPCWVYPERLKDTLYDTRVAYEFLENDKCYSRNMVISAFPGNEDCRRLALTFLSNGNLVSENYQVEAERWDFDV